MNKMLFHAAFVALLTSSGCANPMTRLFAKKPQPYDEYLAQRRAKEGQVASRVTPPHGSAPAVISDQLNAGNAALQRGSLVEAQGHYQSVLQRQPNHPTANHRLAVIADQKRDFAAAERYYQAALAAAPRDASLLNDAGYSYLMQSRHADAERYFTQSLQMNPNQTNAVNNLASLYLQRGQNDQALSLLRRTSSESEAQTKLAQLSRSSPIVAQAGSASPAGWPPNSGTNLPSSASTNAIADASAAAIDPNLPEPTRQLLQSMEAQRRKAITERNAKDASEKAQRDVAMRQAREAELGRAGVIPAGNQQPRSRGTLQSPNAPLVIGPQPNPGPTQQQYPAQQYPAQQYPAQPQFPVNDSNQPMYANPVDNSQFAPAPNVAATHLGYGQQPSQTPNYPAAVPLDTMPSWPPSGTPSSVPQQSAPQNTIGRPALPGTGQFTPNVIPADEAARDAARYGMSAGSLFPMTPPHGPNPNNGYPSPPNLPANLTPNGHPLTQLPYYQQQQTSPQFAPQMPPNPMPPADQLPPSGFQSSAIDPRWQSPAPNWSDSPTQFALQDQFPPSPQYQTPNNFGALPPNGSTFAPPVGMTPSQIGGPSWMSPDPTQQAGYFDQAAARASIPDRTSGNDRWIQGATQNLGSPNVSAPSMQNWIASPTGDQALSDYERLVQLHNAESNSIRQQLDSQRQLPGSELFFRSQAEGPTSSSRNVGPIITPGGSAPLSPSTFPSRPTNSPTNGNGLDQWPNAR